MLEICYDPSRVPGFYLSSSSQEAKQTSTPQRWAFVHLESCLSTHLPVSSSPIRSISHSLVTWALVEHRAIQGIVPSDGTKRCRRQFLRSRGGYRHSDTEEDDRYCVLYRNATGNCVGMGSEMRPRIYGRLPGRGDA